MTPDELIQNCIDRLVEADRCRLSGNFDRAIAICDDLIASFPDYWAPRHTLGLVYADKQDYQKALDCLVRASIISPDNWKTLSALADVYLNLGSNKLAAKTIANAISAAGANPDLYYMAGEVYRRDHKYELAENAYRKALEIDPTFHSAVMGLALSLAEMGDAKEAAASYEKLIVIDPAFPQALFELANLPPQLSKTDILRKLASYEADLPAKNDDFKISFYFAKAAALHSARRYDEAWRLLETANGMMHDKMREELARTVELQRISFEKLPVYIKSQNGPQLDQRQIAVAPFSLFILGPSRCGKSTAEFLLSRVGGICRGYENLIVEDSLNATCAVAGLPVISSDCLPDRLYANFRDIYLKELALKSGPAKVFVNTNPSVIKDVVFMLKAVPNTRVIFIKRNLHDNVFKIFSKLYGVGNSCAYNLPAIKDYILWYNSCIDIIAENFTASVKIVSYEDVVADPRVLYKAVSDLLPLSLAEVQPPMIGNDCGCSEPYAHLMQPLLAA